MKNWKNLFIKNSNEELDEKKSSTSGGQFSFPVNNNDPVSSSSATNAAGIDSSALNEVLATYEKGIDSINMPGYDFYEFYKAVGTINNAGEQAYNMAFQMAKSMDSSVTTQKLVSDAEFYISKINEVHNQYSMQGQQKINSLEAKKNEEKNTLMQEIEQGTQQINQLRIQLQKLESDINQKRITLTTVEGKYSPQETTIRHKLLANDNAKHISISNLNAVKDGILKFIKK